MSNMNINVIKSNQKGSFKVIKIEQIKIAGSGVFILKCFQIQLLKGEIYWQFYCFSFPADEMRKTVSQDSGIGIERLGNTAIQC